ncbi:hypothetical protein [Streptomyces sp. NPDC101776]|uniref:hypothetical protein n=1 Tax=Streptomyces sp. NPDC101776 TaxID=3366146 RepID=UPI003825A757
MIARPGLKTRFGTVRACGLRLKAVARRGRRADEIPPTDQSDHVGGNYRATGVLRSAAAILGAHPALAQYSATPSARNSAEHL